MLIIGEALGLINATWKQDFASFYGEHKAVFTGLALVGLGVFISSIWDWVAYKISKFRLLRSERGRQVSRLKFDPKSKKYNLKRPATKAEWTRCSSNNQNMIVTVWFEYYTNVNWIRAVFDCDAIYEVLSVNPYPQDNKINITLNGCPDMACTFRFYYDKEVAASMEASIAH